MMYKIMLLIKKVINIEGLVILIVLLFFLNRFVLIVLFKVSMVICWELSCFFNFLFFINNFFFLNL